MRPSPEGGRAEAGNYGPVSSSATAQRRGRRRTGGVWIGRRLAAVAVDFGKLLRRAREAKTLSPADLERNCGVSVRAIKRVEDGDSPSCKTLERLAEGIGCPLAALVDEKISAEWVGKVTGKPLFQAGPGGSQVDQIQAALQRGERLTALDALERFGCNRLAARIFEIAQRGFPIHTEILVLSNGKKVAEYRMDQKAGAGR